MGRNERRDMSKDERKAADRDYAKARERLDSYKPKGGREDAEYNRRNNAVIKAEQKAGFWAQLKG